MNKVFIGIALALLANLVVYSQTPPGIGTYISSSGPLSSATCCLPNALTFPTALSTSAATTGLTVVFSPLLTTATVCGNANNNPATALTSITPVNSGATYTFTAWTTGPVITPVNSTAFTITAPTASTGCTTAVTYVIAQMPAAGAYVISSSASATAAGCCYPQSLVFSSALSASTANTITANLPSSVTTANCGSNANAPTTLTSSNSGGTFAFGSFGPSGPQLVAGNSQTSFSIQPSSTATTCATASYTPVPIISAGTYSTSSTSVTSANCCLPTSLTIPSLSTTTSTSGISVTLGTGATATSCANNLSPAPTSVTTSNSGLTYTVGSWTNGPVITPISTTSFSITPPSASTGCTAAVTYTKNGAISGPILLTLSSIVALFYLLLIQSFEHSNIKT